MKISVRWLIRRELPQVLEIEKASFEFCWTEEDFLTMLRHRNCIGMVAVDPDDRVLGYMLYELEKDTIRLLNFAVAPEHRRRGVGRAMAGRLKEKLSKQRRIQVALSVRETNLPAQLFFRALGFYSMGMNRAPYDDTDEDAIEMVYVLREAVNNRIKGFFPAEDLSDLSDLSDKDSEAA